MTLHTQKLYPALVGRGQWRGGAGQPLSSAVLASCNVIVLWFHHQPAQPSCPSPCWSLSQQRKLSLLGTIRSHFEADDCISKRCCVRLKEASLPERFQRGAFGSTAPETRRWLCYSAVALQSYKVPLAAQAHHRVKRDEGRPHLSPSCGFPSPSSARTRQEAQSVFARALIDRWYKAALSNSSLTSEKCSELAISLTWGEMRILGLGWVPHWGVSSSTAQQPWPGGSSSLPPWAGHCQVSY